MTTPNPDIAQLIELLKAPALRVSRVVGMWNAPGLRASRIVGLCVIVACCIAPPGCANKGTQPPSEGIVIITGDAGGRQELVWVAEGFPEQAQTPEHADGSVSIEPSPGEEPPLANDAAPEPPPLPDSVSQPEPAPEPGNPEPPGAEPKPEATPEPTPEPVQDQGMTGSVRIAVISDLNGSYGSTSYGSPVRQAVSALIARIKPDVVLATGDLVAGQKAGLDYNAMWKAFHAAVTTPLTQAGIPLAVTPGNHDASAYSAFNTERQTFVREWKAHKPAVPFLDDSLYPLRYAFAIGPVLFISLDATTVGPRSATQLAWIEKLLQAHASYPVKLLYGHLPIVPFAVGRETETLRDSKLEALMRKHNVTAYLSGHHHAYYPGKRSNVRMISMSCLGSGPRALVSTSKTSPRSVAILEVSNGRLQSIEAYQGSQFSSKILRSSLPRQLNANSSNLITRDDLAP